MKRHVLPLLFAALPAAAAEPGAAEFFERKVRPLLVAQCQECHSARKVRGGLRLDNGLALARGGDSGPAVVPGRPEESLLLRAVRYRDERLHMPPRGKLPDAAVAVLEQWVRAGAVFPGPTADGSRARIVDIAEGRKFWSFQPVRVADLPAVVDTAWPRRRLDHFLLAEMEEVSVRPAAPADRRTLVRRLHFDLTGLPPTPQEVDAFLTDDAPDAYERLVDRLLASPRHGERWGRFWLDLARYCDIGESWSESKGQPWLYRDWVVRALNEDLAYDRFVRLQLAADLLPDAASADRAALGLLGLSPTYWKELKLAPDAIRTIVAEEWEERIATLGGAFLGLTLACARCHDHKHDPVTQQDYYALAGVLASTRLADQSVTGPGSTPRPFAFPAAPLGRGLAVDVVRAALQARLADAEAQQALVPAVAEASLHVLADGAHRTRLEYRAGTAQDVAVQVRGNPANPGPTVPRRFLAVLSSGEPQPFTQGSGRAEFARALVTDAAPLAARVLVNRVWKHHFGTGLVETPSDFGAQGSRPTHPALLDDLAARFLAAGGSLKWLHREIVLSAAYRQASGPAAPGHDNRLLKRMNRRRLEVEAWRDAVLAVTGTLDGRVGGPPRELGDAANHRRTLYGIVRRREVHDLLRLNDFPDPVTHSPGRVPTTTPLQQLFVLNSPFLQGQAAALVGRVRAEAGPDAAARVRRTYQLLYGREPTPGQLRLAEEFLTPQTDTAWREYAQALLASNEFAFVD